MTAVWHGGKGSRYRKIDQQKYNESWDRIFGKNKEINSTSDCDNEDVLDGNEEETETEREADS